jgi:hypothetical protein
LPCKDTTSEISLRLDKNDRLIDFDFAKITCSKPIGGGTGYQEYCAGRSAEEILEFDFSDLVEQLDLQETEDQFLFFLEWEAVGSALAHYLGRSDEVDHERYQIASITYDETIEIFQVVKPLKEMPKIIPCRKRNVDQSG